MTVDIRGGFLGCLILGLMVIFSPSVWSFGQKYLAVWFLFIQAVRFRPYGPTWGRFHKRFRALRPSFAPCAELSRQ